MSERAPAGLAVTSQPTWLRRHRGSLTTAVGEGGIPGRLFFTLGLSWSGREGLLRDFLGVASTDGRREPSLYGEIPNHRDIEMTAKIPSRSQDMAWTLIISRFQPRRAPEGQACEEKPICAPAEELVGLATTCSGRNSAKQTQFSPGGRPSPWEGKRAKQSQFRKKFQV